LNFEELKAKFRKFLKENATPRNIALTLGALTLLSFLGFILITHSPEKDYAVLYTHLNPDDAGEILSVLQESHIPYKVEGDGSIILVPKDKVYEVRLKSVSYTHLTLPTIA
jgi:flagellar M-ring protein FliF